MVGEVSCEYCNKLNGEMIYTTDGCFCIDSRIAIMRDGECRTEPIMSYCASDDIFGCDVGIEDSIVINYCPMCGADLTEGLR